MAKRFGRNQRRKLKEQVARLEKYQDDLRSTISHMNSQLGFYHDWSERVRRTVGYKNDLLPQHTTVDTDRQFPDVWYEVPRDFRGKYWQPMTLDDAVNDPHLNKQVRMKILLNEIEAHPDKYSGMIVYRLRNDIGQVNYAIAEDVLRGRGFGEEEIRWIAQTIALNLAEHFNTELIPNFERQ
jgi:hypothetical protein